MADVVLNGADMNAGASYSGAALPANNDTLLIPQTNSNTLVNVQALVTRDLDEFIVETGHSITIGGSGNRLQLAADRMILRGMGTVWFDNGSTSTTDILVVNSPQTSGDGALQLDDAGGNVATAVIIYNGKVVLSAGHGAMTELQLHSGIIEDNDSANAITRFTQTGGIATFQRPITTCSIMGGTLTQKDARAITTLVVGAGAVVNYESTATLVTAIVGNGGTLDLSPTAAGMKAKTVTNLIRAPGAIVKKNSLVTVENDYQEFEAGGGSIGFGGSGSSKAIP